MSVDVHGAVSPIWMSREILAWSTDAGEGEDACALALADHSVAAVAARSTVRAGITKRPERIRTISLRRV
jgi:hypothetical protein